MVVGAGGGDDEQIARADVAGQPRVGDQHVSGFTVPAHDDHGFRMLSRGAADPRIRTWSDVPIVVLSADGSEDRKVEALDGGADDYMTKPFGMRELDARLRVAVRHRSTADDAEHPAELDVGSLHLDLVHYGATFGGRPLDLTPREFDFLAYLARHVGKVCTRRMILENVWGPGYEKELHYLKVYAYRIRRKLGDENGQFLQSDPAVGYRLAAPDS